LTRAGWHRDFLRPAYWPVRGSDTEQLALLDGLRRMLIAGGLLILDVMNPVWIFGNYQASAVAEIGGMPYRFDRHYDVAEGRSRGSVVAACAPGDPVGHDIRLYTAPEVRRLLTEAGLKVEAIDADFEVAEPVSRQSRYLQFVARR